LFRFWHFSDNLIDMLDSRFGVERGLSTGCQAAELIR